MRCPRCHSPRIQRGYHDSPLPLRMVALHELLCNRCGHEFKAFDLFARLEREPSVELDPSGDRRRAPRYDAHLPATISLVEGEKRGGKVTYTEPSRGHCDSISKRGMTLSFVGSRFSEAQLSRKGRLLFVNIKLPNGPIDAVVSIIALNRTGGEGALGKWIAGVTVYQMDEADTTRLNEYLDRRAESSPPISE